jgi:transcriptional regulator with XRE-family HTH domain
MEGKTIGRTVRWARRRAGMTQQDLAQATGLPQPTIARIERGTVTPRTATLVTMLDAAGLRLTVEPMSHPVDREAIRSQLAMTVARRTRDALGRAAEDSQTSPIYILRRLRRFGVPFVLVGELAEAAHGSPGRIGRTVEVCVAATDAARERTSLALADLGARANGGRLKVQTETAAGDGYDVLIANAVPMHVDSGILVRVAAIEDLVRNRRAAGTREDEEAKATLDAVMEEATTTPER